VIETATLSFGRAAEEVEDMIKHGTAFARVEDAVNASGLCDAHKAALWLLGIVAPELGAAAPGCPDDGGSVRRETTQPAD
jgi:hypothetical protein